MVPGINLSQLGRSRPISSYCPQSVGKCTPPVYARIGPSMRRGRLYSRHGQRRYAPGRLYFWFDRSSNEDGAGPEKASARG